MAAPPAAGLLAAAAGAASVCCAASDADDAVGTKDPVGPPEVADCDGGAALLAAAGSAAAPSEAADAPVDSDFNEASPLVSAERAAAAAPLPTVRCAAAGASSCWPLRPSVAVAQIASSAAAERVPVLCRLKGISSSCTELPNSDSFRGFLSTAPPPMTARATASTRKADGATIMATTAAITATGSSMLPTAGSLSAAMWGAPLVPPQSGQPSGGLRQPEAATAHQLTSAVESALDELREQLCLSQMNLYSWSRHPNVGQDWVR